MDANLSDEARVVRTPRKIRYNDSEWSTILERARASGRPPARYVREASLGVAPWPGRSPCNGALIHELGRIGTTLAKLATGEREHGDATGVQKVAAALDELLTIVRRLA